MKAIRNIKHNLQTALQLSISFCQSVRVTVCLQWQCVITGRERYPDLLSLTGGDWSDRYLALRHPSYSWAASSLPVSHDDKN